MNISRKKIKPMMETSFDDPYFLNDLHLAVIDRLEDDRELMTDNQELLRTRVAQVVETYITESGWQTSDEIKMRLTVDVFNEISGFGPLQTFLDSPDISDILINGPDCVFIERQGRLEKTNVRFINNGHVVRVIRKILAPLGKRIDESNPIVDARLPDGSRVNAIIPPLAIDGACVSIRRFKADVISTDQLIETGSLSPRMADMLVEAVQSRKNILISGGTGSGKTTLLNALSTHISPSERVVTIEDSAELQLNNQHVVRLETRVPNSENEGGVNARDLLRNSLRMRPDRIILGESRGEEVLDMLQAMNTGHMGSMSTVHANSAEDALVRLQMMVRLSGFQGGDSLVNQMIGTALDYIVHTVRDSQGYRYVEAVLAVVGSQHGEVIYEKVYIDENDQPGLFWLLHC